MRNSVMERTLGVALQAQVGPGVSAYMATVRQFSRKMC
jgi:hypothetical protein